VGENAALYEEYPRAG
jgi:AbiV family abortive infection protein